MLPGLMDNYVLKIKAKKKKKSIPRSESVGKFLKI